MLDAACAGEVFTSPVPDQMLAATKLVDGGAGVLHIVKNYTGDVMNFEMAAELAAAETGARVVSVVTDDDVAVQDSTWTAGRRGVGVTVLLEKIAGAAAEQGRDLDEVADIARDGQRQRPQHGRGADLLHRAGRRQARRSTSARTRWSSASASTASPVASGCRWRPRKEIAEMLVEPILADLPFGSGDRVIAFVNGLGGTPLIELYVMYNEVNKILAGHGVTVARSLVGSYITSPGDGRHVGHTAARSTTSCCRSGTRRSGRRPCDGESDTMADNVTTAALDAVGPRASPASSPRTGTT